ncbi:MAG: leucine--tRNA ligase [Candidatus Levybacteria bacterium]|nr:leucine--tRNA ligase [Candidatus Levybacteria bacterium]
MKPKTHPKYFPDKIESKWQKIWSDEKLYDFTFNPSASSGQDHKKKYFVLVELPYPSGDLHIGHWFTFVTPDVLARFKKMMGENVFFRMGYDAFGLPAENAAIKRGIHPQEWTMSNIASMTKQFKTMGTMIDWGEGDANGAGTETTITCLPEYYTWNQWIFLKMYEKGIAYRSKTLSNWCPTDQTVLANEHVENGKCWRCGTVVVQKPVEQWFLKITDYADRLLWPETGKQARKTVMFVHGVSGNGQENWFPWLKKELEKKGYTVIAQELPNPDHPNPKEWNEALTKLAKNVSGELTLVSHSLGTPAALELVETLGRKIEKLVLVAPVNPGMDWDTLKKDYSDLDWDAVRSFTKTKPDFGKIESLVDEIVFYFADDDPYIPAVSVDFYKKALPEAKFIEVKGKGHLNESAGMLDFTSLLTHFSDSNSTLPNGVDWPQSVREGQNNWIGRSEGALVRFVILSNAKDLDSSTSLQNDKSIEVFTTRPDTLYGATFMVVSPEHEILKSVTDEKVKKYIIEAKKKTELERKENKEKTGVFSGLYAINPVTKKEIPIWVADYVLSGYGTGAIMAVPAHDERDFEFAKKFGLEIQPVILSEAKELDSSAAPQNDKEEQPYIGPGKLINSGEWDGWEMPKEMLKVIEWLEAKGLGKAKTQYHLHDWSVSRQRYWGTPVPIINCPTCGTVPVPEKDLPVEIPYDVDYMPKGKPPLASNEEWLHVACPKCGGKAERDPETLDTFFDSSWYYYRYTDPKYTKAPFNPELVEALMPLDIYFGGSEHILGHTLYARFFTKFFKDIGLIDFDEFAKKRIQHGIVLGTDGNKMSKSKGNVINPDDVVKEFGTDAVRIYLSFMMPYEATGPWSTSAMSGMYRFLKRVWDLQAKLVDLHGSKDRLTQISENQSSNQRESLFEMHKTIKKVRHDIDAIKLNTAVAAIMEWLNYLSAKETVSSEEYKTLLLILAPFAPHMTEELWQSFATGSAFDSIHQQPFPEVNEKYLIEDTVTIVVQVNGKVRENLTVDSGVLKDQSKVEQLAKQSDKVTKHLEGATIRKVIYIVGKILNFVVS